MTILKRSHFFVYKYNKSLNLKKVSIFVPTVRSEWYLREKNREWKQSLT